MEYAYPPLPLTSTIVTSAMPNGWVGRKRSNWLTTLTALRCCKKWIAFSESGCIIDEQKSPIKCFRPKRSLVLRPFTTSRIRKKQVLALTGSANCGRPRTIFSGSRQTKWSPLSVVFFFFLAMKIQPLILLADD